jgi:fibronectin-binding autotransporter adhesin
MPSLAFCLAGIPTSQNKNCRQVEARGVERRDDVVLREVGKSPRTLRMKTPGTGVGCDCRSSLQRGLADRLVSRRIRVVALVASVPLALPLAARANCVTSGNTINCDSTPPNPWTTTIGTGPSTASGTTVNVGTNAQVVVGDANAISLGNNATITVGGGALVQNTGAVSAGLYGNGPNTIEFNSNSTLTVLAGGTVYASGSAPRTEAVNPVGTGSVIDNFGTIRDDSRGPIFFQATSGRNTVINEAGGVILETNPAFSVIGTSGSAIDFFNRGTVIGSLILSAGSDNIHLYTGSTITGTINGGGGNNLMTLNGAGSDSMSGALTNFQTLTKQDSGTWTLTGSLGNNGGASPLAVEVQAGTLVLTGNNASFNGTMTVDPAGTLQGTSGTLTPTITNNGLVDFVQPTDGTFTGTISGTGAVAKDGAGVLALTGANTYGGGTSFNAGTVAVGADNNLGAPTGALTFNGGTLQFTSSFNLSAGRSITLNAPGGTIDTQGFTTTIAQGITGAGGLTKEGVGTLTLSGSSTYTGATFVNAGTLQAGAANAFAPTSAFTVASGATLDLASFNQTIGSLAGAGSVTLGSATLSTGNDNTSTTFSGVISGSGGLTQIGTGTLILTGANTYTGATNVDPGALFVDGSIASSSLTTVNNGATLGGSGTVGMTLVLGGGTLAPGPINGMPGTMTVARNLTFQSGAIYLVQIGPAGASITNVTAHIIRIDCN